MTFLEQVLRVYKGDFQMLALGIVNEYITVYQYKLTNKIKPKIKNIGSKLSNTNNREDVINLIKNFESIINITNFEESVLMLGSEYRRTKLYHGIILEKIKLKFGINDKRYVELKTLADEMREFEPLLQYCNKMNDMNYNDCLLRKIHSFAHDINKYISCIDW